MKKLLVGLLFLLALSTTVHAKWLHKKSKNQSDTTKHAKVHLVSLRQGQMIHLYRTVKDSIDHLAQYIATDITTHAVKVPAEKKGNEPIAFQEQTQAVAQNTIQTNPPELITTDTIVKEQRKSISKVALQKEILDRKKQKEEFKKVIQIRNIGYAAGIAMGVNFISALLYFVGNRILISNYNYNTTLAYFIAAFALLFLLSIVVPLALGVLYFILKKRLSNENQDAIGYIPTALSLVGIIYSASLILAALLLFILLLVILSMFR